MRRVATGLLLVAMLLGGAESPTPPSALLAAATPEPLVSTRDGPALRVGPSGSEHFVGLLANGEGALGVAVAADGGLNAGPGLPGLAPHDGDDERQGAGHQERRTSSG